MAIRGQVEVGVVGEVHRRRRIGTRGQRDGQRMLRGQQGQRDFQRAGVPFLAGRRAIGQRGALPVGVDDAPDALAEPQQAAVQVVHAFVGRESMLAPVAGELRTRNAVAKTTHQRAHVGAVALIVLEPVEMQHQVAARAGHRVREAPQDGAIGQHFDLQAVRMTQRNGVDALPIVERAEGAQQEPALLQYLRFGSSWAATSIGNTDSSVMIRFGMGLPATTSLTAAMSCGPNKGLHSTVTLSLPAIMASNAPFTPSMEMMVMSLPGARPASSMAWMAPMAMSSLCANSTLIFLPSAFRKASMTSLPLARVKSPVCERMIL